MNLLVVKERLLEMGKQISLSVEDENAEQLTVSAHMQAKSYFNDEVYLRYVIFKSGTVHLFLTFDEMEKTYDNLFLINKFNADNPWFRAYIINLGGKDFLELHYTSFYVTGEQEAVDIIGYLMTELLKDDTFKYLKPILNNNKKSAQACALGKERQILIYQRQSS